jgi:spore germination protein GerM
MTLSFYHYTVATRKAKRTTKASSSSTGRTQGGGNSGKGAGVPWGILFWLVFAIFIFALFIYNREAVESGIQIVKDAFSSREIADAGTLEVKEQRPPETQQPAGQQPVAQPSVTQPAEPVKQPDSATPSVAQQPVQQSPQSQTAQNPQNTQRPPETRERVLYFIQVDRSGYINRVKANRKLPVSDSPLTDVIQALIAGPDAGEKSSGLISLIPPATKLLSASVRGNTAYISFNEEFQYNTYGVEGYAGQLRQVVFTATEFPNVTDVQILIEGRRIDYLGEGVWVGSPVSRDML